MASHQWTARIHYAQHNKSIIRSYPFATLQELEDVVLGLEENKAIILNIVVIHKRVGL